jgi:hypothetical protein
VRIAARRKPARRNLDVAFDFEFAVSFDFSGAPSFAAFAKGGCLNFKYQQRSNLDELRVVRFSASRDVSNLSWHRRSRR